MADIDPVEWGEVKTHVEVTKETVTDIKTLLDKSIDKNDEEHSELHGQIGETNKEVTAVKVAVAKITGGIVLLGVIITVAVSVWSVLT